MLGDAWHFGLDALAAVGLRTGGSGGCAQWGACGGRRASTAVAGGRRMGSFRRWPTAAIDGVDGGCRADVATAGTGWVAQSPACSRYRRVDGHRGRRCGTGGEPGGARQASLPSPAWARRLHAHEVGALDSFLGIEKALLRLALEGVHPVRGQQCGDAP